MALTPAQKLALERQSGKEMQASRDARRSGDSLAARLYKKRAQQLVRQAHPLKGDRKTA